jgi:hypothetical protein
MRGVKAVQEGFTKHLTSSLDAGGSNKNNRVRFRKSQVAGDAVEHGKRM